MSKGWQPEIRGGDPDSEKPLVLDKDGVLADLSFFAYRAGEQAVDFAAVDVARAGQLDQEIFLRLLLHVFGDYDTISDSSIYACQLRREDVAHMAAVLRLDVSRPDCPLYMKLGYFATQLPLIRRNPYVLFFLDADVNFAGQLTLNPFTRAVKAAYKVDSDTLAAEKKALARATKHSLQQFSVSDFIFISRGLASRGRRQKEVAEYLRFAEEHRGDVTRGPARSPRQSRGLAQSGAAGASGGGAGAGAGGLAGGAASGFASGFASGLGSLAGSSAASAVSVASAGSAPSAAGSTNAANAANPTSSAGRALTAEEVIARLPRYQFNRRFSRVKDVEEDDEIGFDRYGEFLPRHEADELNKIHQGLHGAVMG